MKRHTPPSSLENAAGRYIEARRGRRVRSAAPAAGIAAERVLKPLAKRFGVGLEQLRANWGDIVGQRLAGFCQPETLQRQGASRTLVIRARGPAAAILQAESRRILDRIRTFAGQGGPTRLRIIQGAAKRSATAAQTNVNKPKASSQVSEGVEETAEARLMSALNRFDRSVKTRRSS